MNGPSPGNMAGKKGARCTVYVFDFPRNPFPRVLSPRFRSTSRKGLGMGNVSFMDLLDIDHLFLLLPRDRFLPHLFEDDLFNLCKGPLHLGQLREEETTRRTRR